MSRTRFWRIFRLSIAALLLLGYACAAVWLYRECTAVRTTAADGSVSLETTCAPPTLTSATVLVLLLLVGALLWPDISELAVLGVSLKRRIETAQAAADNAADGLASLRDVVQFQQTQLEAVTTASASSILNLNFGDTSGLTEEQKTRLQKQADEARTETPSPSASDETLNSEILADADLKLRVLADYEQLSEALGLESRRGRGRPTLRDAHLREVQRDFIDDHAGPLRSVRAVRNAVAHAREVSPQELQDALVILSTLNSAAREHLSGFEDPHAL